MEKKNYDLQNYPLQQETDTIIKAALEIHKILGSGFLEIVYKDAFEYEFRKTVINSAGSIMVPFNDTL